MKKELLKKEKRDHILKSAAQVFARRGYNRTLIADIATEADIGKGTVYEYFKSKEDLFFAVFEWFVKTSETDVKDHIAALGGSVSDRLMVLSRSLMETWIGVGDLYTLVMEFWSASASSKMRNQFKNAFRKGYQDYRYLVSALIQEGIDRGEFRVDVDKASLAASLVGTWDALLLQAWFDDGFDPLAVAEHFMSMVIRGMRCEKDGSESGSPLNFEME